MIQPLDNRPEDEPEENPDAALRRQLLTRIALAGVVIAALLGGLALMDNLAKQPEEPVLPKMASLPPTAPAEEKPAEPVEEKPAEPAAEEKKADAAEEDKTETPPVTASPGKPLKPLTQPAEARPASIRPSAPAVLARPAEPARELTPRFAQGTIQPSHSAPHAPASKPLSGPLATPPVAESKQVFVVQMGVFNNVSNAEELRAKLELAGIPAQIEARVKVGPFGSREEAEAARRKMADLGLDQGFLTAAKK